jgi:hypothetical protein
LVLAHAAAPDARAVTVVGVESAMVAWSQASGPVVGYNVYISRNDQPYPSAPDHTVTQPSVEVSGGMSQIQLI